MDVGSASVFRVRVNGGDRFAAGVDVSAARPLTVDEIIARHQAAAARQAAEVRTSIATGSLTLTFEAPGLRRADHDHVADDDPRRTRDRHRAAAARHSSQRRVVHGARRGATAADHRARARRRAAARDHALRCLSLPARRTRAGQRARCLRRRLHAPRPPRAALRGTRLDRRGDVRDGARVRGADRPEGTDHGVGAGTTISLPSAGRWRLARSNVRQTYEGAAVRTPIHRLLVIDRYEVNPPDFDARRAAAYASTDVMLRDTPEGFRYLKREAGKPRSPAKAGSGSRKPASRRRWTAPA